MRKFPELSPRYIDPHPSPKGTAYTDGQYLPVSEAKISVLDYGFLHSDATYDVVHVWKGAFFRLDAHIDRFFQGLEKLHMSIPYNKEQVAEILHNVVALSGLENAYVEFICTRGNAPDFSRDPRNAINRFIAFAIPFGSVANPEQLERGLHIAITDVVRIPPPSVDPTIKNYHWLDLVRGLYDAYERGAETALLLDSEGNIAEGPGFNIFIIKDGAIATPDHGILQGITRQTIFDLCQQLQLTCTARRITPVELENADEVFITSTAGGVMPVTKANGNAIGSGIPGPVSQRIKDLYWAMHDSDAWRSPVTYPDH
ncbi:aminotransferase class IV [Candidatus Halocynthiibacter alkanivorans]|uniref:aminotransferase class IV n=1 Tax=Candidatus Halocynthiibacter alkanivorans TaxID=2267619 RepID=UPI000DF4183A|nr:aminotransferase class IV [Candidatus Halocynthiibacter alkanivorans]